MALTDEQQKLRLTGIGGSEIAAVCGLNPWMRPIDVYLVKTGVAQVDESSHHLERGNFLERGFIDWYAHRFKRKIEFPGTIVHPKFPLVIATPDAVADERYVVEIKAPSFRTAYDWGDEGSDEIPDYYLPQTQWEMAVTGLTEADIVAFMDGDIRRFRVAFNQELFDALRDQAQRFWRNYVAKKEPPPEDGSASYSEYLATRFPKSDDPAEVTDAVEVVELVKAYKHAQGAVERAEEAKEKLRQKLEMRIGERSGIKGAWGSISFKWSKPSTTLDAKRLEAEMPAIFEKFQKPKKSFRAFRPTLKKEL